MVEVVTAHDRERDATAEHPTRSTSVCCVCGRAPDRTLNERGKFTVELRPYGPGGAPICFECATATPEAEAQIKGAFGALLDAAQAASPTGTAVIGHGHDDGPDPLDARTLGLGGES